MARHKHADLIHAWAEGAEIEVLSNTGWCVCSPTWVSSYEYRIKPEKKPDKVIETIYGCYGITVPDKPNLRITIDGETGKLKKAEVIDG